MKSEFRSHGFGTALYKELAAFAKRKGVRHIILDTPAIAHASHKFYEKNRFRKTDREHLPIKYLYPDRDSLLYILAL